VCNELTNDCVRVPHVVATQIDPNRQHIIERTVSREPGKARSMSQVHLLRGRQSISALAGMLEELCRRTNQTGAMHWLEFFLGSPLSEKKIPTLVMVGLQPGIDPAKATADDLSGAVLLYEYKVVGVGMRVFTTDDATGWRTVIAPIDLRAQVAEEACRALLERGGLAAVISFEGRTGRRAASPVRDGSAPAYRIATRNRVVPRHLLLAETFDATLAGMGRHTRRNLRYYRRRLEEELGSFFVSAVAVGREEFLTFNRKSTNPVENSLATWRYNTIHELGGTWLSGVKGRDGRWLSLIGGRRYLGLTEIDWQMNLAGLPRYSLSTVMRSYMLEHEVGLGTKELAFTGGTPHTMRHSFQCVEAADVIVLRQSVAARLLFKLAGRVLPDKNFLVQALCDRHVPWT
jgi:hypothetical protein